jgi:glycosyltransferase involved in cell wall biosynthesis
MNVLVNAVSIKEGGSRVVLSRLLSAMCAVRPDIAWIVAANPACIPAESDQRQVTWLAVPFGNSAIGAVRWYELALPSLVKRYRADVLFSQTNYLPRRRVDCPTLLLVQHAGHFSAVFDKLTTVQLRSPVQKWLWRRKRRWVHRSARSASLMTVQTAALADAVSALTDRIRDRIVVIPHGPGLVAHRTTPRTTQPSDVFAVGYVSKWGVQKDFDTLFRAAQILRAAGRRFKLVLTLDRAAPGAAETFGVAHRLGIVDLIENHGEVEGPRIEAVYDSLDALAFPSLCEAFGFPTVEAMARGVPIVVSATSENLEVARGAALSFAPGDAGALADQLKKLMDDDGERADRAKLSLEMSRDYSWERAAMQTIAALERAASRSP